MEFGTLIFTKPQRAISDSRRIERLGFTHAWFADSQMIWGDVYACMALAAVNTTHIKLATGISVATNRIPPVTVHAIGTINEIAPGRTLLGYGTGHTGRRVMGLPPVKFADPRIWRKYHMPRDSPCVSSTVNACVPSGKWPQKMIM